MLIEELGQIWDLRTVYKGNPVAQPGMFKLDPDAVAKLELETAKKAS